MSFDSDYKEDVHALYTTLLYNFTDKLGVQLGARAEQAYTKAILNSQDQHPDQDHQDADQELDQGPHEAARPGQGREGQAARGADSKIDKR